MTRQHGKSTEVYLDERDYSGISNAVTLTIDVSNADVTAFDDTDLTLVEGKPGVKATINGFYSLATPNYDGQSFTDLLTAQRVGIYSPATDGKHGYEFEGYVEGEPRSAAHGNAITLNVNFKGDSALVRTIVLKRDAAMAASADGTAYNHGAVSASQLAYGIFRMFSVSGGPGTLDAKIQSDALETFLSPTDVLTSLSNAAAGVEVKTAAGPNTDTWWRVVVTIAGGGTWDLVVAFGIIPAG